MSLIHYNSCPSCNCENLQLALKAIDHTVSHETFEIWECQQCGLRLTQNVPDAASVGAYYRSDNYISHTNTNEGLINRLYHLVRKQTLSNKYRLISSATRTRQGKLLDIGAGTGAFVAHMKQQGWEVTGLEPDEVAREKARTDNRVQLLEMDQLFSFPPVSFDAITLWHVLEHVHELHPYMERLKTLIKRDGRIFIAVPNYTSYDAAVYQGAWAAYDVPRHLYHFSPDAMENLLTGRELQLQYSQPMRFDSFYISLLTERYRNGRGNILKAAWTGLISNMRAFVDKAKCSSLIYIISK